MQLNQIVGQRSTTHEIITEPDLKNWCFRKKIPRALPPRGGTPPIQKAIKKIVESGRVAGTLTSNDNVAHFTDMGVRFVMTSVGPWIDTGAANFKSAGGIA